MKPGLIFLFIFFASLEMCAQTFANKKKMLQNVFDNIISAYGNAKAAPQLLLLPNSQKERVVAAYSSAGQPNIKVDEQLIDICLQLKIDSLNALATIVSHELAHYYNDDTFCSDYAFATKNKTLLKTSKESSIEKETKADRDGLFYAMIVGYQPLQSFEIVLNSIYKTYRLPANLPGYPTLTERKKIIKYQTEEVKNLQAVYNAGLVMLYLNYLSEAANCFSYLSMYFPSREVYNNLGVAKFLEAVQNNADDSLNIIYPIDIDPVSRLYVNNARGIGNESKDFKGLLKEAKTYFEKAKTLDPNYFTSYINLACANTALHNYDMALGDLNEAEELKNKNDLLLTHIRAIIAVKQDKFKEALLLFENIMNQDSVAAYNYKLVKTTLESNYSFLKIENYKDGWINFLQNHNTGNSNCHSNNFSNTYTKIISVNNSIKIKRNNSETISINLDDRTINAVILPEPKQKSTGIQIINNTRGCITLINKSIAYEVEML